MLCAFSKLYLTIIFKSLLKAHAHKSLIVFVFIKLTVKYWYLSMEHAWSWFQYFTSLGGLSQYFASKNVYSKILWIVLTLIGLIFTILGINQSLNDYLANDVTVSVDLSSNDTLFFPTVSICNVNRVHCGNLRSKIIECKQVMYICWSVMCRLSRMVQNSYCSA